MRTNMHMHWKRTKPGEMFSAPELNMKHCPDPAELTSFKWHCMACSALAHHPTLTLCRRQGAAVLVVLIDPWCHAGINCGVLLIRNTGWARTFFADVGQYSYMDKATLDRDVRPVRPAHPFTKHHYCFISSDPMMSQP